MKKVVLALAAVAVVACFSLTSCNKKCTCKATVLGVTTETEQTIDELNKTYGTDYKKCSDFSLGPVKCE